MSVVSERRQFQPSGALSRVELVASRAVVKITLHWSNFLVRLARLFIFTVCGRTYVRPVALSARHVFFIVGHLVAAAAS